MSKATVHHRRQHKGEHEHEHPLAKLAAAGTLLTGMGYAFYCKFRKHETTQEPHAEAPEHGS